MSIKLFKGFFVFNGIKRFLFLMRAAVLETWDGEIKFPLDRPPWWMEMDRRLTRPRTLTGHPSRRIRWRFGFSSKNEICPVKCLNNTVFECWIRLNFGDAGILWNLVQTEHLTNQSINRSTDYRVQQRSVIFFRLLIYALSVKIFSFLAQIQSEVGDWSGGSGLLPLAVRRITRRHLQRADDCAACRVRGAEPRRFPDALPHLRLHCWPDLLCRHFRSYSLWISGWRADHRARTAETVQALDQIALRETRRHCVRFGVSFFIFTFNPHFKSFSFTFYIFISSFYYFFLIYCIFE